MKSIAYLLVIFISISAHASELQFANKRVLQIHDKPKYAIEINYPQLTNNSAAARQLNLLIKQAAFAPLNEFKKNVYEDYQTDSTLPPSEFKGPGATLKMTYELTQVDNDMISIRLRSDVFRNRAAHPSRDYSALNYDLANNKKINVADLFDPSTHYLQFISGYTTQYLTKKLGDQLLSTDELQPKVENFGIWNITHNGIRFTFNEDGIAPHSAGPQEVTISFHDLAPYILSHTIINKCFDHACSIKEVQISQP